LTLIVGKKYYGSQSILWGPSTVWLPTFFNGNDACHH